ncbi:MAG: CYTH domain-containing protein [Muribaculaceae bacterium]|jgi:adenylate cyclase|nr:CYTH domain-containing protein [Muribaculaceae bacterium]
MALEIERKFLVKGNGYLGECQKSTHILQAYLSINPDSTVRIRIIDECAASITIKSKNHGAKRHEWEYKIPVADAKQMLENCAVTPLIDKTRYVCGRWEVDCFSGHLSGLTVAEIELHDENEDFDMPGWIGKEVTGDKRYYNSMLATCPEIPPVE